MGPTALRRIVDLNKMALSRAMSEDPATTNLASNDRATCWIGAACGGNAGLNAQEARNIPVHEQLWVRFLEYAQHNRVCAGSRAGRAKLIKEQRVRRRRFFENKNICCCSVVADRKCGAAGIYTDNE